MQYKGTLHIAPVFKDGTVGELVKVPTPQSYGWSKEDLDSSEGTGRNNATGEMFRDRVASKVKLSFTWPPLSVADTAFLLQQLEPEFIVVTYLDAFTGGYATKTFYAGPQSCSCGNRGHWLGLKANLIEK